MPIRRMRGCFRRRERFNFRGSHCEAIPDLDTDTAHMQNIHVINTWNTP